METSPVSAAEKKALEAIEAFERNTRPEDRTMRLGRGPVPKTLLLYLQGTQAGSRGATVCENLVIPLRPQSAMFLHKRFHLYGFKGPTVLSIARALVSCGAIEMKEALRTLPMEVLLDFDSPWSGIPGGLGGLAPAQLEEALPVLARRLDECDRPLDIMKCFLYIGLYSFDGADRFLGALLARLENRPDETERVLPEAEGWARNRLGKKDPPGCPRFWTVFLRCVDGAAERRGGQPKRPEELDVHGDFVAAVLENPAMANLNRALDESLETTVRGLGSRLRERLAFLLGRRGFRGNLRDIREYIRAGRGMAPGDTGQGPDPFL